MSELIQKNYKRATIRWELLTGASALVLTAYVSSTGLARAEESDRPQVWIELGGQLNRLQDSQETFAPPFVALTPTGFALPQAAERPPLYNIDGNLALKFQPKDSDWVFSASVRYGRATSGKQVHHQSYPAQPYIGFLRFYRTTPYSAVHFTNFLKQYPKAARFTDGVAKESEDHAVIDFQAGKDVGLGLFGHGASSTLNLGVRIAQFKSTSRVALKENPDWHFEPRITSFQSSYDFYGHHAFRQTRELVYQPYHSFAGTFRAERSFSGEGPSISWSASVPFAGNESDGELTLDWGVNAAMLFGRQKTKTHHQTTGRYGSGYPGAHLPAQQITYQRPATPDHTRSRSVSVPNVGGSLGLSWRVEDFKMSLGYRTDFFFGAIDGGIDVAKDENRAFYGPYASISIGLGSSGN